MKLLLDENLPKKLKNDFPEYDARTLRELGWNGFTNGQLLSLMIENGFEALITFDKNLRYQQNFQKYPIMVIVLSAPSNQYKNVSPLIPLIHERLLTPEPGISIIST